MKSLNKIKNNKKVLNKYFLILISIIISFLVIEIFLNIINYPHQACKTINNSSETFLGKFDNLTGWSYKSSFSYHHLNNIYEYHFNEDGIRVPSKNYKFDPKKPKIVFIGGSVVFGEGLNFQDTFPAKINELLEDKFEIVNLGVQGFGTAQSMIKLEKIIEKIKPQYVVYTFIPDHINRNINYDRRLHFECLLFSGTKPVFIYDKDNSLIQIKKPKKYSSIDKLKLPLLLNLNYQNHFEKIMIKNNEHERITKGLIENIDTITIKNNAKSYYIFYDNIYDESPSSFNNYLLKYLFNKKDVLNFTNWATDSLEEGTKYFINEKDNYHPNKDLSSEIAKKFVEKFFSQN